MDITLTTHGEELVRAALDRYPDQSASDIVEQALADRLAREQPHRPGATPTRERTAEEIAAFFEALAAGSEKIPALPTETFSRQSIYQDHD